MNSNTIFEKYTTFELYLEGIKVPFTSISISESENAYPQATITLVASSRILKTLPGTIVQFFGPDPVNQNPILLFEGNIIASAYQKSATGGRFITFTASSLIQNWESVTARPSDALMTKKYRSAAGEIDYKYYNLTSENKEVSTPETIKAYSEIIERLEEKQKTSVFENLENALSNINFTQAADISDEISQLFGDKQIEKGDVYNFILFFLRKFELHDPFYGITANSFNIAPSVAVFPNVGKLGAFKRSSIINNTFALAQSLNDPFNDASLNLMGAINQCLQTLQYTMINPSTYTGSRNFWSEGLAAFRTPVRSYFMPSLENAPPAKFNVFFPHQVSTFSFSRNMISEPTRTIGYTDEVFYSNTNLTKVLGTQPFVVEPLSLDINSDSAASNSVGFTPEETYRGINPNVVPFTSFFTEANNDLFLKESKGRDEITEEQMRSELRDPLNELTEGAHQKGRLASRTFSMSTTWSPYRMVGIPGVYIEDGEGPSVTGVVNSIVSNFTATGQVSSTITMRAARIIEDIREFATDDIDENTLNEFTTDPYVDTNSNLYDSELYSFFRIGSQVYSFLKSGDLPKDTKILEYSENEEAFPESSQILKNILNEASNDLDESILDYVDLIENEDGSVQLVSSIPDSQTSSVLGSFRKSVTYTKSVYEAIYALKDLYNAQKGRPKTMDSVIKQINYRRIIEKNDYFNFIGLDPTKEIDRDENYKDSIELFRGSEKTEMSKAFIEVGETQPVAQELAGQVAKLQNGLKVYSQKRQDAINRVSALKEVLEKSDNWLQRNYYYGNISDRLELKDLGIDPAEPVSVKNTQALISEQEALIIFYEELNNEIQQELENLEADTETSTVDVKDFANNLFKPYNLIRRAHVKLAFSKYIKEATRIGSSTNGGLSKNLGIVK